MKKMNLLIASFLILSFGAFAQTNSLETSTGSITTLTNQVVTGTVKQQFRNRGSIVFINGSGKKQLLSPNDIAGFQMGNEVYISYASDFYKTVNSGKKLHLLQRVTDNSGKIYYNGSQAVICSSLPGKSTDFYLQLADKDEFVLINAENFYLKSMAVFADCAALVLEIKNKEIGFDQLATVVDKYNTCK